MLLSDESSTPSASAKNAMVAPSAAPHNDRPGDSRNDGASATRPLTTILSMLSSLIAATSASVVVTHFSAVFIGAPVGDLRQRHRSSALQRIGGGKAVARDPPLAVVAFLEDEKLLVCLAAGGAGGVDRLGPCGIGPHKSPLRRHDDKFSDGELDLERDGSENRIIGLPQRRLADRRLIVWRHEYAVLGVKRHGRVRARAVQRGLVGRHHVPDRRFVRCGAT